MNKESSVYFDINNLTVRFGGLVAVDQVSFTVEQGSIVSLVGPNGAGKTTIFNALTGFGPFEKGSSALFKGKEIMGLKPLDIVNQGMTRSFQKTQVFNGLTVLENIITACNLQFRTGFWANILGLRSVREEEAQFEKLALETLDFFNLLHLKDTMADSLAYGDARFLEVAVAVATGAEFLLLDEPAAGLNPVETHSLMDIILKVNKLGKTILIIEHDMKMVMAMSTKIVVVCFGKKIAEGSPTEIASNPQVIEAYLGANRIHAQDNL